MTTSRNTTLAILALAALLGACQGTVTKERVVDVVWSDDQAEFGVAVRRFEKANDPIGLEGGDRTLLFAQEVSSKARTLWEGEVPGYFSSATLYFMRSRGYMVFGVDRTFRIIRKDSQSQAIPQDSTCQIPSSLPDAVPSPDGALIAAVDPKNCGNWQGLTVRFLDATTLAELARDTVRSSTPPPHHWEWRPTGDFLVGVDGLKTWKLLGVGHAPLQGTARNCMKTTSSRISNAGIEVYGDGERVHARVAGRSRVFGC